VVIRFPEASSVFLFGLLAPGGVTALVIVLVYPAALVCQRSASSTA